MYVLFRVHPLQIVLACNITMAATCNNLWYIGLETRGGGGGGGGLAQDVTNIYTCSADRCLYIIACMPRAPGGCVDVLTTH